MEEQQRIHEWVLDGTLGRGGMATVWRCRSAICPRLKGALKLTDPMAHESARARFLREVDALARLRHHGVVRVLSAGEWDGRMYLVMELIEGEDLLHRLQRGPMEPRQALFAFRVIADGLRHAHAVGIHHRDLKPANVMLTQEGGACLVDFGIALDVEQSRLTRAGTIPGTVTYMAPELLSVDAQEVAPGPADVYSLGQVLYEAVTGRRAFDSPHGAPGLVRLVRHKHSAGALDPGEGMPPAVRDIVRRCTDPDPRRRPTMSHLVRLLDAALSPDELELGAIDEATRAVDKQTLAAETSWPFDLETTEEGHPSEDDEETLVMKILEGAEQARLRGVEEELDQVVGALDEEYSLSEPGLPENAVFEDEEVVQAFDSAEILGELRAERMRQWRSRALVALAMGALLVALLLVILVIALVGWLVG